MIPRLAPSGPQISLPSAPGTYDNGNSGAAAAIDWSRGPAQEITATANTSLDLFGGLVEGESARMTLKVIQGGAGNHGVVLPFANTTNNADLVFSTTPGHCDLVDLYFDGHNLWASFFATNVIDP